MRIQSRAAVRTHAESLLTQKLIAPTCLYNRYALEATRMRLLKRLLTPLFVVLAAIIIVIEEVLWVRLNAALAWLDRAKDR